LLPALICWGSPLIFSFLGPQELVRQVATRPSTLCEQSAGMPPRPSDPFPFWCFFSPFPPFFFSGNVVGALFGPIIPGITACLKVPLYWRSPLPFDSSPVIARVLHAPAPLITWVPWSLPTSTDGPACTFFPIGCPFLRSQTRFFHHDDVKIQEREGTAPQVLTPQSFPVVPPRPRISMTGTPSCKRTVTDVSSGTNCPFPRVP